VASLISCRTRARYAAVQAGEGNWTAESSDLHTLFIVAPEAEENELRMLKAQVGRELGRRVVVPGVRQPGRGLVELHQLEAGA
jgi:hypothetical protein